METRIPYRGLKRLKLAKSLQWHLERGQIPWNIPCILSLPLQRIPSASVSWQIPWNIPGIPLLALRPVPSCTVCGQTPGKTPWIPTWHHDGFQAPPVEGPFPGILLGIFRPASRSPSFPLDLSAFSQFPVPLPGHLAALATPVVLFSSRCDMLAKINPFCCPCQAERRKA